MFRGMMRYMVKEKPQFRNRWSSSYPTARNCCPSDNRQMARAKPMFTEEVIAKRRCTADTMPKGWTAPAEGWAKRGFFY
jgi:hypothetical protein